MSFLRPLVASVTVAFTLVIGVAQIHPTPVAAADVTIAIRDGFDPATLTVAPGTAITWINESGERHRVRTTSAPEKIDSGNLEPGEAFTVTLTAVGTYRYEDHREPDDSAFWAEIVVSTSAGAPTAEPSSPDSGSGPASPGAEAAPTTADIGMADRVFRPATVTIAAGGVVTWRNDDDRAHTATSTDDAFDSGLLAEGDTWDQQFPTAGTFRYLCVVHPEMTGTVVVVSSDAAPVPAPAEPAAPTPPADPAPPAEPALPAAPITSPEPTTSSAATSSPTAEALAAPASRPIPSATPGAEQDAIVPARATSPADYVGIVLAVLLSVTGAVLFLRTIGGVVRRPELG